MTTFSVVPSPKVYSSTVIKIKTVESDCVLRALRRQMVKTLQINRP